MGVQEQNKLVIKDVFKYCENPLSEGMNLCNKCINENVKLIEFDFSTYNEFPYMFIGFLKYFRMFTQERNIIVKIEITNINNLTIEDLINVC